MAIAFARRRLGMFGLACALAFLVASPAYADEPGPVNLCGPVLPGFMHCDAAAVKRHGIVAHRAALGDVPYGPADLQSAYGLTSTAASYGADQTVAIVDAYDLPSAESDLALYRSHYGLPPCTTANGCFKKVNQAGTTSSYPAADTGWGGEIALDLDAVSATCPQCHILLVEANSSSGSNLAVAVNRAAAMGATQISNSYGGPEFGTAEVTAELSYNHPGIALTVSSGDSGYGVEYPAASQYVTAVGGTSLYKDSSARGWSESAWSGSGSGCSGYIPKPAWQTDSPCAMRTVADVSAVADPYTGIATYDTHDGWQQVGGTSLAAPVVAAAYALTGSAASAGGFAYANPSWFNDVTSGSNGSCPITSSYLCNALTGFDGPTGMGTPASAHPGGPPPPEGGTTGGSGGGSGAGPTPAPPVSAAPAKVLSSVSVAAASSRPINGRLRLKLVCGGGPACRGTLNLQTRLHGTTLRTLGRARYSVDSGKSTWVVIRMARYNVSLLEKRHRLRAYGTALDSDGTSAQSSFMLHAPKPAKRRKR